MHLTLGLQKRPILAIVLRVGILELPGPGMLIAGMRLVLNEDCSWCLECDVAHENQSRSDENRMKQL